MSVMHGWGTVELVDGKRVPGYFQVNTANPNGWIHVSIPSPDSGSEGVAKLYPSARVASITTTTEEVAREAAKILDASEMGLRLLQTDEDAEIIEFRRGT